MTQEVFVDLAATKNVVRAICVAQPSYREWLQRALHSAAAANNTTAASESQALFASMQRTLADVTWEEAEPILSDLERGDVPMPVYGELPRFIRSEALERRAINAKRERERAIQYAAEPRYKCLHCRDTGIAHVLDPQFVRAFRKRFEAMTEADFANEEGGTWWHRARVWFRTEHGARKVEYGVACCCDRGSRLGDRMQRLDVNRMPVLHGILWVRDVLAAWYAKHDASEVEYWVVPDLAEAE